VTQSNVEFIDISEDESNALFSKWEQSTLWDGNVTDEEAMAATPEEDDD